MMQQSLERKVSRPRLGDLLIREGLVSPEHLQRALDEQRAYGGRLGRHLVDMGAISEEVLLNTLSEQLHVPKIDLDAPGAVSPEAARYCRADLAEQWGFCPVSYDPTRNLLTIAVSDPDPQLLADIEGFLALKVEPRVASTSAIERAFERLYSEPEEPTTGRLAGLQVSRSVKERQHGDESPFDFPEQTAPVPPPAHGGVTPPGDPYGSLAQQLQALQLQQLQIQAQHAQVYQPPVYTPVTYPTPPVPGVYHSSEHQNPYGLPMPSQPTTSQAAPVDSATIERLVEQIGRLERTLSAQARALRSLVEVLVDKGLLSKAEMARKQQQSKH